MKRILLSIALLLAFTSYVFPADPAGMAFDAPRVGKQSISACSYSSTTPFTVGDADRAITCTPSSGLACALSTNNASYCTIVSGALHAVGAGACVAYCDQAGNPMWYAAAQANQGITVSAAAPGYAFQETFDGGVQCVAGKTSNCDQAWYSGEANVTWNDTTIGLSGTYNAKLDATSAISLISQNITSTNEAWFFFLFRTSSIGTGDRQIFDTYGSVSGMFPLRLYIRGGDGGNVKVAVPAGSADTVGQMAANTTYCVWAYYKRDASAAIAWVEFQTPSGGTCTYVGSGNNHQSKTGTASDYEITQFSGVSTTTGGAGINYFDKVIYNTSAIGNVTY